MEALPPRGGPRLSPFSTPAHCGGPRWQALRELGATTETEGRQGILSLGWRIFSLIHFFLILKNFKCNLKTLVIRKSFCARKQAHQKTVIRNSDSKRPEARSTLLGVRTPRAAGSWRDPWARGTGSLGVPGHRFRGGGARPVCSGTGTGTAQLAAPSPSSGCSWPCAGSESHGSPSRPPTQPPFRGRDFSAAGPGSGWLCTVCMGSRPPPHAPAGAGPGGTRPLNSLRSRCFDFFLRKPRPKPGGLRQNRRPHPRAPHWPLRPTRAGTPLLGPAPGT